MIINTKKEEISCNITETIPVRINTEIRINKQIYFNKDSIKKIDTQ